MCFCCPGDLIRSQWFTKERWNTVQSASPIQLEKGWMWCSWASKILLYCQITRQEEARWELKHDCSCKISSGTFCLLPIPSGLIRKNFHQLWIKIPVLTFHAYLLYESNLHCLDFKVWYGSDIRAPIVTDETVFFIALIYNNKFL